MIHVYLHEMLCWKCKKDSTCKLYQAIDREPAFFDYLRNMFKLNGIELSISIRKCNEFEEDKEVLERKN